LDVAEIDITPIGKFAEGKFLLLPQRRETFAELNLNLPFVSCFHFRFDREIWS
jgi:hypothetical protein